jgi:hypothetical protein
VTEAEWLACTDPEPMLGFLRDKVSDRKLRLFAVACCRRVWPLIRPWYRAGVETAERYADGLASDQELEDAPDGFWPTHDAGEGFQVEAAAGYSADRDAFTAAAEASGYAAWASVDPGRTWLPPWQEMGLPMARARRDEQKKHQADTLRDIFGPMPFRPVSVEPAWLRWNSGTVLAIARRIYDERRFEDMPIPGDALEDAGCTDADILTHCRGGGPHVRGCWVLDLLLGKE